MGTQLRLVEGQSVSSTDRQARRPRSGKARTARRSVRWRDWRLDEQARRVGRQGVAQARAALEQASRPEPPTPLPRAS